MRKEIFDYLQTGQEAFARIRVEHIIREENIMAAYEILGLFCEFVLGLPVELQEVIASIVFASPRCSDLPELADSELIYCAAASELQPDSNVNRLIIEKLTARAPSGEVKLKTLKGIAKEFNLGWDSSSTETDFSRKHEDLLDGSLPMPTGEPAIKRLSEIPSPKNGPTVSPLQAPLPMAKDSVAPRGKYPSRNAGNLEPIVKQMEIMPNDEHPATSQRSSKVLERARTAIAVAERATAAARAAAELVNVKSGMSGQQRQTFWLNQVPGAALFKGILPQNHSILFLVVRV